MCFNDIQICVFVGKQRNENYVLSFNLDLQLVTAHGYGSSTHVTPRRLSLTCLMQGAVSGLNGKCWCKRSRDRKREKLN
jgi:hypothetical protein